MNLSWKNEPFNYKWRYPEPIQLEKTGPRLMRFTKTTEIFGVSILKGYEVDGATVPRMLWFVLSPFTEAFRAACVHDWRHHKHMTWQERKAADAEFYVNLRKCRLNVIRSMIAWFGVRAWAWITFLRWK